MPTPSGILDNLTAIANHALALALVWHVVAAVAIAGLWLGWRPTARTAALLIAAPAVTVSVLAFAYGNLFNGTVFAALVLLLLSMSRHAAAHPVHTGAPWTVWLGSALVAYALVYPHFLESHAAALYLVAAPVGLVPCPTLAAMIGFTLLAGRGLSEGWWTTLFAFGVFYGLFGMLRLGVWLDAGLLAGAIALIAAHVKPHGSSADHPVAFRHA